jgi:hypothetical protein
VVGATHPEDGQHQNRERVDEPNGEEPPRHGVTSDFPTVTAREPSL